MKAKLLLFFCALLPLVACSQTRLLSSLPSGKDVSLVYVSPAMMKVAGAFAGDDETVGEFMKEVKSIEIYNSENKNTFEEAIASFDNLVKETNAQEMVSTEEKDEVCRIYMIPTKNNPEVGTLVVFTLEKNEELSIVVLNGKIDLAKLASLEDDKD